MSLVDSSPRTLGDLGAVGPLAFGMWRFTDADLARRRLLVETAIDHGMTLIDTADVYGLDWNGTGFGTVEEALGEVLRTTPGLRDRMVLATKGGIRPPVPYDSSADGLRRACEDSLRRLGVDTIDLYQIHRPDIFTHPAEVAATLTALHDEGKIRAVGVSNHTVAQTVALDAHLPFPLLSTQPEFSAAHLDPMRDGTLDHCMTVGLTPMAWSPLAGGLLAGLPSADSPGSRRGSPQFQQRVESMRSQLERWEQLCRDLGEEPSAVGLAWLLHRPGVTAPVVGPRTIDQLDGALHARSIVLSPATLEQLDVIFPGPGPAPEAYAW